MTANASTWRAPLVMLADGRQVPSDSAEWRAECEARVMLAMGKVERDDTLARIGAKRGANARADLERLMVDVEHQYILDCLPTREARRAYLAQVEKDKGPNQRQWLEQRVAALWQSRKDKGV